MKFLLYILFALDTLNLSLFVPIAAPYIISLGGSHFTLGIFSSTNALISLTWNSIAGSLSDSKGRRTILLLCLSASCFGNFLAAFSSSIGVFFFARLICAFGTPVGVLLKTILSEAATSVQEKNSMLDVVAVIMPIAFTSGALLTGFISEFQNGFSAVFFLIAVNFFICIVLALLIPKRTRKVEKKRRNALSELKSAIFNIKNINWNKYWDIFVIKGFVDYPLQVYMANLSLILLHDYHFEGRKLGYFFMIMSIFSIFINILKMKLKQFYSTYTDYKRIFYGCIALFFSLIGLGLSKTFTAFAIFTAAVSMVNTFLTSTFMEVITSKSTGKDRGRVLSAFENLSTLASLVAPPISGVTADIYGERATIALSVVPLVISLIVCLRKS